MEVTAVEVNPGQTGRAGEGNIYEVEQRVGGGAGQPHYSLPVRGGRSLPSPPDTPSVTVTMEELSHHHHVPSNDKIYETLSSLSSLNQPEVPARPPWTFSSLQLPEEAGNKQSPLYLMMPPFQCSQVQKSDEKKVDPSHVKTFSVPDGQVSSTGRRKSLSEAGKQFFRGMSLSMSRPDQFDYLIEENDENDSENDDVFC